MSTSSATALRECAKIALAMNRRIFRCCSLQLANTVIIRSGYPITSHSWSQRLCGGYLSTRRSGDFWRSGTEAIWSLVLNRFYGRRLEDY